MKKRQNRIAQVGALIALIAIVMSIVGTALIFIFSSSSTDYERDQISQEEIEAYLDSLPNTEAVIEESQSIEASSEVSQ